MPKNATKNYLRLLTRCAWVYVLAWTGCLQRAKRRLCENGSIVTLTFHRVLDDISYRTTNSLPGIVIRERTFGELISYLAERCELVDLSGVSPGKACQKVRIACTFDDGWRDNYTTAFSILRAYKVPATIFVCPELLRKTAPFWPEQASALLRATRPITDDQLTNVIGSLKHLSPKEREQYIEQLKAEAHNHRSAAEVSELDRTMSWDEIGEMDKAGVRFGSHTDSHQILTTIPRDLACEELQHSKTKLESNLGKSCKAFAYPNGDWSTETKRLVEETGFTRAVTTLRGAWTSSSDELALPRCNVSESDVIGVTGQFWPAMFEYTTIWKAWRAMPRTAERATTREEL
ncbi:MAG TPA: polysaccharide deacetylase family protein [Candidatus Sulfotelmatobacter sp.]|nr:polysaccharide deacetylase family protein [Candidatus Sulfotelmatobacter sp.]